MKLKMSFFNLTLFKKNIIRYSPAWAMMLILLLLAEPYDLLVRLQNYVSEDFWYASRYYHGVPEMIEDFLQLRFLLAGFTAILFAGMLFQYLHKANSAYMIHAFPMTRSCLFLTNAVSGLLFFLVPVLLSSLCQFAVLGSFGGAQFHDCVGLIWTTLAKSCLMYLFFYGLAVFCVILSGQGAISWLSYGALNVVFLLLPLMVLAVVKAYLPSLCINLSEHLIYLAPAVAMQDRSFKNLSMLAIYAGIGLLLLALAWLLYRCRHIEHAGDPMAYGWARIVFRLVFTLSVALGVGLVLTEIFAEGHSNFSSTLFAFVLMWCFIGWFASSMIIERTIKVFRLKRVWIGFAAFAAVLSITLLGIQYDLLGLQKKIPQAEAVESVELWSGGYGDVSESCPIVLTRAEDIELIRSLHQQAIDHDERGIDLEGMNSSGVRWFDFCLCYRLKNGRTLRRCYAVDCLPQKATDSLEQLCSRGDLAADYYERLLPKRITAAELNGSYVSRRCRNVAALRDALLADAAAGDLPIPSLFERNWDSKKTIFPLEIYALNQRPVNEYDYEFYETLFLTQSAKNTFALFDE